MHILIYGGKGWLASFFIEIFEERNLAYTIGESRVDNITDLQKEIKNISPTHILCCIGRTSGPTNSTIDYLEDHLYENLRDNLYSPLLLALECLKNNIHLTYLGTGCLFDYNSSMLEIDESSDPNFFGSKYSTVKGFTDNIFRKEFENVVLNLRIRLPISNKSHPKNFLNKILSYPKIHSAPNSVTVIRDIFPLCVDLMIQKQTGTFNAVNTGTIDHKTIIDYYTSHTNSDHKVEYVSENEISTVAKRSNIELDNSKLQSLFNVPNATESVMNILDFFDF